MADKTVIIKLDVQEAGAISSIEGLNNSLKKLDKTSDEYAVILKKIQAEETKLASIQKQRAGAQKSVTKALGKQSDATGSATAATMELSRVVSDAPYGIRGMANNITQLVSQLGTASTKAGGLTNALKLMGKQLLGPLGIVFAITAVVSALDFFFGANTKAEKSLDGFRTSAAGAASDLKSLLIVMKEDMLSKEDLSNVIDKVNEKYKDLNLSIGEEGRLTKDSIIQIDKKIASLGRLALANAMLTEIENKNAEVAKAASKMQEDTSENLKKLGLKNISDFRDTENQRADETKEAFIERRNQLIFYQKGDYKGQLDMEKSNRASSIRRQLAAFDETKKRVATQVKELLEISTNEGFFEDFFNSKDEKGGSKKKKNKVDVLGLDSIDIGENKKKMKKVLDAVADAVGIDLKKDPLKIDTNLDLELSDEAKKIIADKLKSDLNNLMLDSKLEDAKNFIDKSKEVLGAMTDFVDSEFERELTIEQNKTNALNTELNNRLNNENLSKEQRASIQNQIAQNDEKLRVKQDAIEKKKFKMNKAARIANALMDTASAAIGVMADSKGGFFARLANAIPTIAFGLAQVAAISRQKFKSSASKTPINTSGRGGGVGGSSERPEASFNIVGGRTKEDALLGAIQAKFDQPVKAYVVSGDVTSQQELDRVIVSSSSF